MHLFESHIFLGVIFFLQEMIIASIWPTVMTPDPHFYMCALHAAPVLVVFTLFIPILWVMI